MGDGRPGRVHGGHHDDVAGRLQVLLLDPTTLAERAAFAWAEPIDAGRIVVVPHGNADPFELRNVRTGELHW